jgi:hypothetical protein
MAALRQVPAPLFAAKISVHPRNLRFQTEIKRIQTKKVAALPAGSQCNWQSFLQYFPLAFV